MKANKILTTASDTINNRASERDQEQERSMLACVNAFNALYGTELTETMGWQFMVLLKMSRAKGGDFKLDDYIDGAAYFALAGESAAGVDESVVSPPLPEEGWIGNQWTPVDPAVESKYNMFKLHFDERLKRLDQGSLPCKSIDSNFKQWCTSNGYSTNEEVVNNFVYWLISQDGIDYDNATGEERITGVMWK